jgi:hypothetical protein
MEINGTVDASEMEFTVELDTNEVWEEIEEQVICAAQEAADTAVENADISVDYNQGATDLLREYTPGTGCSLAREFESAVQGAVSVNNFLKDVVREQVAEHTAGGVDDIGKIRAVVREEIRLALTAVAGQLTSVV